MDNIKKEIVKQSGEVLSKGYDDLVHPSAVPVGEMISFLPRTIRIGLSRWEKWIINGEESLRLTAEALRDKVENIPEEKQCEPEPYVAVPAIQQIAYCFDSEELRDMYANLLASSMNIDKKWEVHPGYVDIIKQITPDEAKILKFCPFNSLVYKPLINLQVKKDGAKGEVTLLRNYSNIADVVCEHPERISQYLENLNRLKLIHIPDDMRITDDAFYEPLINSNTITKAMKDYELKEGEKLLIQKKLFYVTDFGVGFQKCCIGE